MRTLKVLSVLLTYPEAETLEALDEMVAIIEQEQLLLKEHQQAVIALIAWHKTLELLELQAQYVALFDRGRFLSLHIFEHVHGESRDRGQAMVNLLQLYNTHGFEMTSRELPDFIPLFLEFLSEQTQTEAIEQLHNAMPVLSLLGARLNERGSLFHGVFDALAGFAGEALEIADIKNQAAHEGEDVTLVNMDEIWEEEAVSFMGAGESCQSSATESPVKFSRSAPKNTNIK